MWAERFAGYTLEDVSPADLERLTCSLPRRSARLPPNLQGGSGMDPTRLPHTPPPLAADSQTTSERTQ
jgi:hypothetical protein